MENNSSPNFAKLDMKETKKFHMLTNSPESGISDYPKINFESNDTDNDSINIHAKCNLGTKLKSVENIINDQLFDDMKENTNNRFDDMKENTNNRFDDMKENTNNRFDGVNNRLDDVNNRLDDMEKSTNKRLDDVNNRLDDMKKSNRRFWMSGIGETLFTIITIVLASLLK